MSETNSDGSEDLPVILSRSALTSAVLYWDNLRRIGYPGEPSLAEMGEMYARNVEMARTAALVSIAESLDRLMKDGTANQRRMTTLTQGINELAKELTRIRYILNKTKG